MMRSLAILSLFALCAVSLAETEYDSKSNPKQLPVTKADVMLANVTKAAASTKMDAQTFRLEEAADSAEKLKMVATKAAATQAISHEDAKEIKKAADNVQKAAASGDHVAVIEHVEKLHEHLDEVVASKKGPEVANKLQKADAYGDKPVLSTKEDEKLLRAAVAEVVEADQLIPPEKKQEATNFTVSMIKEGFRSANTTNAQLVTAVEMQAAKQNKTVTEPDSQRRQRHIYPYGYGYPYGSYYDPTFYYGYGYRQCLYWSPYSWCRQRLFGDYAFHHGFHHFFHRHHRHHWG